MKGTGLLGELARSRTGSGRIQDEPGALVVAESEEVPESPQGGAGQRDAEPPEDALSGQRWDVGAKESVTVL